MAKPMCTHPDGCPKPAVARKLCSAHWMAWRRAQGNNFVSRYGDPVANFWPKVQKRGHEDCWLWTGGLERTGYGHYIATHEGVRHTKAHRFAYHVLVGAIPAGLDLDHLCHTRDEPCRARNQCPHRRCVNPAHLEPVPERINILRSRTGSAENARKTHCIHGHPFSGANLYINPGSGARVCRECKRAIGRRSYVAKKQRPAAA